MAKSEKTTIDIVNTLIEEKVALLVSFLDGVDELKSAGIDLTAAANNNLSNALLRHEILFGAGSKVVSSNDESKSAGRLLKVDAERLLNELTLKVDGEASGINSTELKQWFVTKYPEFEDKWNGLSTKLKDVTNYQLKEAGKPRNGGTFKKK